MDKPPITTATRDAPTNICMHQIPHQVLVADHQSTIHQVIPITQTTHSILNQTIQTQAAPQYIAQLTRPVCITTPAANPILPFDGTITDANAIQIGIAQPTTVQQQVGQSQQIQQVVTTDIQALSNMMNEKVAIYRHPLFPLLRIMFEKCEIATNSIDSVHAITFDNEIKSFITQMAKESKPFFTDDAEVDGLMLKSLQVLRIHLLELEKVNELCKDFCTRYISCLKGKLNSDNIMRTLDINTTPPSSPTPPLSATDTPSTSIDTKTDSQSTSTDQFNVSSQDKPLLQTDILQCSDASALIPDNNKKDTSKPASDPNDNVMEAINGIPVSELTSGFLSKKNKCGKRGVLPKQATNVLKAWLFQHLVDPYPSEEEKKQLADQTNLSNLQVNNWFINARRRILQPMLETTNSFLKNNKKAKLHKNAAQNNWTSSIGVYNAYRTEALQQQSTTTPVGIIVSPTIVPQSSTVIVNLNDGQTQPVIISQPLQFVQVSQIPVQAIAAAGCLNNGTPNIAPAVTQVSTISSTQASIVMPLLDDKAGSDNMVTALSEG